MDIFECRNWLVSLDGSCLVWVLEAISGKWAIVR